MSYKRGTIGMKLGEGEQVLTATNRLTTPFPRVDLTTERKAIATLKRVDQWLIDNAIQEAEARCDRFNLASFRLEKVNNFPQASKDSMEHYLFGEMQSKVIRSIFN